MGAEEGLEDKESLASRADGSYMWCVSVSGVCVGVCGVCMCECV